MWGRPSLLAAATLASSQRRCASACSRVSNSDTKGDRAFIGFKIRRGGTIAKSDRLGGSFGSFSPAAPAVDRSRRRCACRAQAVGLCPSRTPSRRTIIAAKSAAYTIFEKTTFLHRTCYVPIAQGQEEQRLWQGRNRTK